jgi:tRNA modification GTPase
MFSTEDSIVALATPEGRGGIGVIRISGASSLEIARRILTIPAALHPRQATFGRVRSIDAGGILDEVLATYFPAPRSYTGEDVVEISAHGSPVVLRAIVRTAIAAGARLAAPGEFTLRGFLNGKRDLVQAEAVADLVSAVTPLQARVAFDQLHGTLTSRIRDVDAALFDIVARLEASLDFPDEGYHFVDAHAVADLIRDAIGRIDVLLAGARHGRVVREGATVVMVGRPNVGKSSIFNWLIGSDRAIVAEIPGTTRDLVVETQTWQGLAITMVDTAGMRTTDDDVERQGVERAEKASAVADLQLLVLDASAPLRDEDERLLAATAAASRIVLANKSDLPAPVAWPGRRTARDVADLSVSASSGAGMTDLRDAIAVAITGGERLADSPAVSNDRHIRLLQEARERMTSAEQSAANGAPEEFVLSDLHAARSRLDEIVGVRTPEDVLRHIFERFCIGK